MYVCAGGWVDVCALPGRCLPTIPTCLVLPIPTCLPYYYYTHLPTSTHLLSVANTHLPTLPTCLLHLHSPPFI